MEAKLIIGLKECNFIVNDEMPKKGEVCFDPTVNYVSVVETNLKLHKDCKKTIASNNSEYNLLSIDYNGFEEEFDIVDIDKLAEPIKQAYGDDCEYWYFKKGFNKAQSLNDKKFSLEDIERFVNTIYNQINILGYKKPIDLEHIQAGIKAGIKLEYKKLLQHKVFNIKGTIENNSFKITDIL